MIQHRLRHTQEIDCTHLFEMARGPNKHIPAHVAAFFWGPFVSVGNVSQ